MERTYIKDLGKQVGKTATIMGFAQAVRKQGSILFLIIRDRTGLAQAVITKSNAQVFATASALSEESVVSVTGLVKAEKQAPGGFELEPTELVVFSVAETLPIPIVPEKGGGESEITKRLDWRWLDLRQPEKAQIFWVWTELEAGFREYWLQNGFVQVYSPSFMNIASESGAEVFEVKYFEKKAYLAQSPQFYKQMALAAGFERVFMVGPVFRAEPSFTTRHMTEFTGWDFEVAYIQSHFEVMEIEEQLLVSGFKRVKEKLKLELDIPQLPFPRLTLAEVKEKLESAGVMGEKQGDLSPEEERQIGKIVKQETGSDFVWVIDYPIETRAFYHMRHEDNQKLTKGFDLLYIGLEVTTGAQREHRIEKLEKQAKEKGMDLESLKGYLNFFRFGCPPHGGVGIGPGRLVMKMLDLESVKEATFLPRDVKRLTP